MNEKKIPFFTAVFMTVNIVVGAGLYAGSHEISAIAGNAGFMAWLIIASLYIPIVYSVSRLAMLVPGSGGYYRYNCVALGNKIGFMSGWLYFLCYIMAGTTVLSALRGVLVARFPESIVFTNAPLFLAIMLSLIVPLNLIRLSLIGQIQKYLTFVKLAPAVLAIAVTPLFISSSFSIAPTEWSALLSSQALTFALFGFLGFEFACSLGAKIEGGMKSIPKVLLTAFALVTAIFVTFHFSLLQIMGKEGLVANTAAGFAPFIGAKLPLISMPLDIFVFGAMLLCFFNSSNGILTMCTVQLQSMVDDREMKFSDTLSKVNNAGRPWLVVLACGLLTFLFGTLTPNTALLANSCSFGIVFSMTLVMTSLLVIQLRKKMYSGMPITLLALAITLGLLATRISAAGNTLPEKLINLSPLIISVAVGFFLMADKPRKPTKKNNHVEKLVAEGRGDIAP